MALKQLLAVALVVSCASIARSEGQMVDPLEGIWLPSSAELGGNRFPDEITKTIRLTVKGDQYIVTVGTQIDRGTCTLNSSVKPSALDIKGTAGPNKGKTILAIYERTRDSLRVCYDLSGKDRPTDFTSTPGSQHFLVTYQLQKQ